MSSAIPEAEMKAAEVLLEEPGSASESLPGTPMSNKTILGEDTDRARVRSSRGTQQGGEGANDCRAEGHIY